LRQTQPTFSVCIPIFNHGKFIGDTIQSVLNQTYPHFEIVIADNASTDNSVEEIRKFKDSRIKLHQNRYNIGFAPNLQRVTMYAKNNFINLLSSDDQMKPNTLEIYADTIQHLESAPENLVLYSDVELFDNDNRIVGYQMKTPDTFDLTTNRDGSKPIEEPGKFYVYEGNQVLADALSRMRIFAPFLSTVYSRSLWEAVEGYNSVRTIGPDKHFAFKLLSLNPKVIYIPQILYRYRSYVSDNRAVQFSTLKQAIDDYLYTLEYRDAVLKPLGLSEQRLIDTFVDQMCLKRGLSQMGYGNYANALRFFAFALASYPAVALQKRKAYMLLGLLVLGPLGKALGPVLLRRYKRFSEVDVPTDR